MRDPHSKITSARRAAGVAIDAIADGTFFAVIAGATDAAVVFPSGEGMERADAGRSKSGR